MKYIYIIILLLLPALSWCQEISGTVRNVKRKPIQNVRVTIAGTPVETFTNSKGEFKITLVKDNRVVRFTSEDYDPFEFSVSDQRELNVILIAKLNALDDVHIIAYGTSTQRNTVGSITKVSAADIGKQAISNPLAALQGRVPGLVITSTSGLPGAAFNVQIRGQNTLNPNKSLNQFTPLDNPLFIVDGVPFATQNNSINQFRSPVSPGNANAYNNHTGGLSPFNSINPADIESIEILRDADATAIYGSRGGNGVIIITTKKGKAGHSEFNINVLNGVSVVGHSMPMMNTQQYIGMRKEAFKNDGITPTDILYDPGFAPDLTVFDSTKNTNWKKAFLGNTAHNLNVNTSLSGGNATTQFRIGGSYNRDTYVFPGSYADNRMSLSSNIHHVSDNKKLTIDFSTTYSYDKNNSAGNQALLTAFTLEPNYPSPTDNKGNLQWNYNNIPLDGSYAAYNPYAYLRELYKVESKSLNGNLLFGYKILNNLTFRTSLGYGTFDSREYYGNPISAQNPSFSPIAAANFGNSTVSTWIAEPQLEYKNTFKKAVYSVLVGGSLQKNTKSISEADGLGYVNDNLIGSISGSASQSAFDSYSEYKYIGLFGRLNVKLDDKYILNITARRDGSSRFGADHQFGNFGSIGAGWLFNEENFIKSNLPFLTYGKLRGSYGITGSDAIADYQYISRWSPTTYAYQGNLGIVPQNLSNPQFGWATTKKLELGLELGFLSNRILLTSAWYQNRSGNQLVTYQLPAQTGFTSVLENLNANVQNTGIEISIQTINIKAKDFSWNTSINFTAPKNKLLSFPGIEKSSYATTYIIGQPLSVLNKFKSAGVDPQTGLFQFYNAEGQITGSPKAATTGKFNDFQTIGNLDPKFYGGLSNSFGYRQFHLDIFLEFKKQLGVNYLAQVYTYLPGNEFNQPVALLNRWTMPGQVTNIQRFSSQYGEEATRASYLLQSDAVYSDASYIRFKTVAISYDFPESMTRTLKVHALRIYATGQNLFTITGYKGNDPETQSIYGIPPLRTISGGLQLTL